MGTIRLPPLFVSDRLSRDLSCGEVQIGKRYAYVEADYETLSCILRDAEFYIDSDGPDVDPGLRESARATVRRLHDAGVRACPTSL